MSRIVALIVASNSMKFLPECLQSLDEQGPDVTALVVDNGSTDGLESYVRGHHPRAILLRNVRDLGWSRALNQAIAFARAQLRPESGDLFLMTVDPRLTLEPGAVGRLLSGLQSSARHGSAGAKILRAGIRGEGEFLEHEPTDIIHSAGLVLSRWRDAALREAGQRDRDGSFTRYEEVFGIPAELALYRLTALEAVAFGDEYFDERFGPSLAGLDLAWRLQLNGWTAVAVRGARAYRRAPSSGRGRFAVWRERYHLPAKMRSVERRDFLLVLAKNEQIANVLIHLPLLVLRAVAALAVIVFTDPVSLGAIPGFIVRWPAGRKRRGAALSRSVPAAAIRHRLS